MSIKLSSLKNMNEESLNEHSNIYVDGKPGFVHMKSKENSFCFSMEDVKILGVDLINRSICFVYKEVIM